MQIKQTLKMAQNGEPSKCENKIISDPINHLQIIKSLKFSGMVWFGFMAHQLLWVI